MRGWLSLIFGGLWVASDVDLCKNLAMDICKSVVGRPIRLMHRSTAPKLEQRPQRRNGPRLPCTPPSVA